MSTRLNNAMVLICLYLAGSGQLRADGQYKHYSDDLRCGGATARLETDCIDVPDGRWECTGQSLHVHNSVTGLSRAVNLDEAAVVRPRVSPPRMLNGSVAAWNCIRSAAGVDYLLLVYACRGLMDNRCAGHGRSSEWSQIVTTDGQVVAGSRNDVDEAAERRLGLDMLLERRVPAIDVGPFARVGK